MRQTTYARTLAPFDDRNKAPVEANLEADLFLHLRAFGAADIQKVGPAGGKTDIHSCHKTASQLRG